MEDDLEDIIRSARKSVAATENDGNPAFCMPENRHTPFDCTLKGGKKVKSQTRAGNTTGSLDILPYQWAEAILRSSGSQRDRALMAVRDAARLVIGKGKDPTTFPFYVAGSIAKGWNLNAKQLSEGLKGLEATGDIVVVDRKKGRHLRMTLSMIRAP